MKNHNDPDLVQAFLKKWWVESDIPLSYDTNSIMGSLYLNVHFGHTCMTDNLKMR